MSEFLGKHDCFGYQMSTNSSTRKKALKQSIKVHCFVTVQSVFDNIDIVTHDNDVLDGEKWIGILQEHHHATIRLWLEDKRYRSTRTSSRKTTHVPAKSPGGVMNAELEARTDLFGTVDAAAKVKMSENTAIDPNTRLLIEDRIDEKPQDYSEDLTSDMLQDLSENLKFTTAVQGGEDVDEHVISSSDEDEPTQPPEIFKLSVATDASKPNLGNRSTIPESSVERLDDRTQNDKDNKADGLEHDRSPGPARSEKLKEPSNITIPHFFSWATSSESTSTDISNESSVETTMKVLETVHRGLQQTVHLPKNAQIYRKSKELTQFELELMFPSLKNYSKGQTGLGSLRSFGKDQVLGKTYFQDDVIHKRFLDLCDERLASLYMVLNSFLSLYFPLSSASTSDHPLVQKFWGAFEMIMTVSGTSK